MTEPIKGFDVSHHQDPDAVPWAELKRQGFEWCYIRAAYGLKPDRRFAEHAAQAEAHGIEWGPYLYLRDLPGLTPLAQVEQFAGLESDGWNRSLHPCLDVEEQDPSPEYLAGAKAAAEYLSAGCVIYTGAVYRVVHGLSEWCDEYPCWIADHDGPIYGFEGAHLPEAHQHTDKGKVAGYGPLDLNVAHDLDALRIAPRKVEAVGDRVPEVLRGIRARLDAMALTAVHARPDFVDGLVEHIDRLTAIIEQDAEVARGGL